MNGKTWARGAALTVAFTVICTNMVGCAPSTPTQTVGQKFIAAGWERLDADTQIGLCTYFAAQPGITVAQVVQSMNQPTDAGVTAADTQKFLSSKCAK